MPTMERTAFMNGLYSELVEQYERYSVLLNQLLELEARVDVAEKSLKLVRDALLDAVRECGFEDATPPQEYGDMLFHMRFIGMRAAEACLEILRTHGEISMADLLQHLNYGMFRFKTGSPEREIYAALLRQPNVTRDGDRWIYASPVGDTSKATRRKEAATAKVA